MFELAVAARLVDLVPTLRLQLLNNLADLHEQPSAQGLGQLFGPRFVCFRRSPTSARRSFCVLTPGCIEQSALPELTPPAPLRTIAAVSPTTTAQLQNEAATLARLWSEPSLPDRVSIRLNRRLTTTLARYKRDTRTIEVGVRFLALRSRRSEVLAHELAHAAVHIRHGRSAPTHGKWRPVDPIRRHRGF